MPPLVFRISLLRLWWWQSRELHVQIVDGFVRDVTRQPFCSVLFFSRHRSEGWPHRERTFSIFFCPVSFWLPLPRGILYTYWCCPWSRPCVVFIACVHLALFRALSLWIIIIIIIIIIICPRSSRHGMQEGTGQNRKAPCSERHHLVSLRCCWDSGYQRALWTR